MWQQAPVDIPRRPIASRGDSTSPARAERQQHVILNDLKTAQNLLISEARSVELGRQWNHETSDTERAEDSFSRGLETLGESRLRRVHRCAAMVHLQS